MIVDLPTAVECLVIHRNDEKILKQMFSFVAHSETLQEEIDHAILLHPWKDHAIRRRPCSVQHRDYNRSVFVSSFAESYFKLRITPENAAFSTSSSSRASRLRNRFPLFTR
jgi:hypothetical protein